jgi:hypothetical protein
LPRRTAGPGTARWLVIGLTLLSGVCLGIERGSAQVAPTEWHFTSLPLADLWFHGMALVDPVGPGPNPLYDPAYPREVEMAKEEGGLGPTTLDQRAGYFREAFRKDPSFEVLHFLPLYFPVAGRAEVFTALRLLADTEEGLPRAPSRNTAFGVAAVGSVLTTRSQREVLGEFLSALEAEWSGFLEAHRRETAVQGAQIDQAIQTAWNGKYGPALTPWLVGAGMSGGLVALTPAVGEEGRIFGGSPDIATDNVLVVSAPMGPERGAEVVYSMLRELSFPMVREVIGRVGRGTRSQSEEESLASRAAIRSGALILEVYCPDDLNAYRQFFLSRVGHSTLAGEAIQGAFLEVYPLDASLEEALRGEILSTARIGGVG